MLVFLQIDLSVVALERKLLCMFVPVLCLLYLKQFSPPLTRSDPGSPSSHVPLLATTAVVIETIAYVPGTNN